MALEMSAACKRQFIRFCLSCGVRSGDRLSILGEVWVESSDETDPSEQSEFVEEVDDWRRWLGISNRALFARMSTRLVSVVEVDECEHLLGCGEDGTSESASPFSDSDSVSTSELLGVEVGVEVDSMRELRLWSMS